MLRIYMQDLIYHQVIAYMLSTTCRISNISSGDSLHAKYYMQDLIYHQVIAYMLSTTCRI